MSVLRAVRQVSLNRCGNLLPTPTEQLFQTIMHPRARHCPKRQFHSGSSTGYGAYEAALRHLRAHSSLDEDSLKQCARLFVSHVVGKGYSESGFHRHGESRLAPEAVQRVRALCEDRCADQDRPLQYVLGNWGFCGHEFLCRQPILIPRPETEELVELVRANLQSLLVSRGAGAGPLRVLDIGCGTGAIGVALLAPESDSWEEQGCDISEGLSVTAIDINPQAVELAQENADRILGADRSCRYRAVHCSVQDFGTAQLLQADASFDVVVSNPPYIPRAQLASLDRSVRYFEDPRALDGGEDQGLELIKLIIARCPQLMRPTSGNYSADCAVREAETRPLWMEVDLHQGALLQAWAADSEEGRRTVAAVTSFRDFTDRPRFVRVDIRV